MPRTYGIFTGVPTTRVLVLAAHMDIFWANAAVFALPSSQRVEVLVHDGASDLRLWPGPGPDRNLVEAYGPGLNAALDAQRKRYGEELPPGEVIRLHPGKLHCNYLLWASARGPEQDGQQGAAPSSDLIGQIVVRCLQLAADNGSLSVGFGAFGDGPGAASPEERLACVVRAAHRYQEECYQTGRGARVEIVRVCDPRSGITTAARRLVGRLAQTAPEPRYPAPEPASKRTVSLGRKRATTTGGGRRSKSDQLDPEAVAQHRVTANPYDRARRYQEGDWFLHTRFGVGCVRRVTPEGAIEVLFEDGATKKLLHAHPG